MGWNFADALWTSLWMGFWGAIFALIGVLLLRKALNGDITFGRAFVTFLPLVICYLGIWAGGLGVISWLSGGAALGYLTWLAVGNQQEEKQIIQDLVAADIEKWSRTIAEDDRNAGAHLFLGHALVRRRDYDAAAAEYQRSLELDPSNARSLMAFLAGIPNYEAAEIHGRIPNLEQIAAEVKNRGQAASAVAWEKPTHVIPAVGYQTLPTSLPGTLGVLEGAGVGSVPEQEKPASSRQLLGYESDEERIAEQELYGRLNELRAVTAASPDDAAARLAFAQVLEEVGQPERAREEYEQVLKLDPESEEAQAAIARLDAPPPPPEEEEVLPEGLEFAVEPPAPLGLPPLVLGDPDLGIAERQRG